MTTRQSLAIGLATVALAFATAPAFAAPDVQEDDPGWSCVDDGNRVCGPNSDDYGHTPGCYDDGGVLVAPWPCYLVIDGNGDADVHTGSAS